MSTTHRLRIAPDNLRMARPIHQFKAVQPRISIPLKRTKGLSRIPGRGYHLEGAARVHYLNCVTDPTYYLVRTINAAIEAGKTVPDVNTVIPETVSPVAKVYMVNDFEPPMEVYVGQILDPVTVSFTSADPLPDNTFLSIGMVPYHQLAPARFHYPVTCCHPLRIHKMYVEAAQGSTQFVLAAELRRYRREDVVDGSPVCGAMYDRLASTRSASFDVKPFTRKALSTPLTDPPMMTRVYPDIVSLADLPMAVRLRGSGFTSSTLVYLDDQCISAYLESPKSLICMIPAIHSDSTAQLHLVQDGVQYVQTIPFYVSGPS